MTAPKTDRRILRTRALLRQGLAELMQEKNAGDITVKELVAHANVNRSTFYLHYTDIDQMLASIEAELLERIEASVQAHPIDPHQAQIFPLVGDLFALMAENREICAALLGPHGDMAFLLQIEAILSRYSLQVLADATRDRRADLDSGYSFCLSGCVGLIKNWLQAEEPAPPEVMAQRTYRLIHNAMRGLCRGWKHEEKTAARHHPAAAAHGPGHDGLRRARHAFPAHGVFSAADVAAGGGQHPAGLYGGQRSRAVFPFFAGYSGHS